MAVDERVQTVYFDSSVLVAFLYKSQEQPTQFQEAQHLVAAIVAGLVKATISFYALPELYAFVRRNQPEEEINLVFRLSLVQLFSVPFIVLPFLDRQIMNDLRQQFRITDPDDARHVAAALFKKCDAIITFDHDFQQVTHLIPAYTPDEFLATLEQNADVE